jgi:hypothetical protein
MRVRHASRAKPHHMPDLHSQSIARSSHERATFYRTRSALLREMAEWQDIELCRERYKWIARELDALAEMLEAEALRSDISPARRTSG